MHAATAHGGFSVTHSRLQAKSRQKVTSLRSGAFLSLWRWLWKPTRVGLDSGPCRLCLFLSMRFLLSLFLYNTAHQQQNLRVPRALSQLGCERPQASLERV